MNVDNGRGESGIVKSEKKVSFVLSGGGNRGALEAGVLLTLLEQDIKPHILVGTSVGAINAAAIAYNPTEEGAHWLEEMWLGVTKRDVLPNNYLSMVWRFITGESGLFDNRNLRDFVESKIPEGISRFNDIKNAELFITAVDLHKRELHVFGIDRSESILDAIMASTALPLFLSPWQYRGRRYVDGAILSDLPIRVAVEMEATEIYAIDVGVRRAARRKLRGIFRSIGPIIDAVANQHLMDELGWASKQPLGDIWYMHVDAFEGLRAWDFDHTAEMIETGRRVGLEYLRQYGLV